MNILETPETQQSEFGTCKMQYLVAQNKLLSIQSNTISKMIKLYKQVIDIASQPNLEQNSQEKQIRIEEILTNGQKLIDQCLKQCRKISESKQLFQQSHQPFVTPQFFTEMVLSYEKTIAELKAQIHHRQITLQELQVDKNHRLKRKFDQVESTAVIRAIQSYDIYPKLSERCRKEIIELKIKKKKLQSQCAENQCDEPLKKCDNFSQTEKAVKKIGISANSTAQSLIPCDNMSTFEKTILVYKKKKLFNQILERKVIDLKKKIKEKEACNQVLRKRLQNDDWEDFNRIKAPQDRNFRQENVAYLSILNESMRANNLDFSVDISRIIPENLLSGLNNENKENKNDSAINKVLNE